MIIRKGKYIMAALFCASMVLGFCGCGKTAQTGEKTNGPDYSAPKIIKSDEISGFYADFFLGNRWTATDSHNFCFRIDADENGVLTVHEDVLQISHPADSEIMASLQDVISENKLSEMNGINSVTASLAPGYQRCSVTVDYISGEKLQFDVNNDPHAQWAEDVYTVFADWFAQNGNSMLYPKAETSPIESFVLKYKDDNQSLRYRTNVKVFEETESVFIEKTVYDILTDKTVSSITVPASNDYYKDIAEIIDSCNLVRNYDFSRYDHYAKDYGNHDRGYYGMGTRTDADEKDADNLLVNIYIKYQSGKTINIKTSKTSEIEGMKPLLAELVEYHSSLF